MTTAKMLNRLAVDVPRSVAVDLPQFAQPNANVAAAVDPAPAFTGFGNASDSDATRALICLTGAIYYEARSQTEDGQRAVAQVVLNRVRDRAFPNSVCGVVLQGSHRSTGCQFSFTCDQSMDRVLDPLAWKRARAIAVQALAGAVYAPVGSSTFYHADYVKPWWASAMVKVATVGAHIFYRWAPSLESKLAYRQPYSGHEPMPSEASDSDAGDLPANRTPVYGSVETVGSVSIYRSRRADTEKTTVVKTVAANPAPTIQKNRERSIMGVRVYRGGS